MGCKSRFLLLAVLLFVCSCGSKEEKIVVKPARQWKSRTLAIVAPVGDPATKTRLERTAKWFQENFRESQKHNEIAVDLKLEWYDELSEDLEKLSVDLAVREDVIAIVGPFSNEGVATFASVCRRMLKPLIAPTATSEEIVRRYAVSASGHNVNPSPFLWSLTETDVSFAGLLMTNFATVCKWYEDVIEEPHAAFFSPDDAYGKTFNYWAPFFALQDNIDLQRNSQFSNTEELLSMLVPYREVMKKNGTGRCAIFCVAETAKQMYDVARANRKAVMDDDFWPLLHDSSDPDDPENDRYWLELKNTYQTYFAFSSLSEEGLEALGPRGTKILQGYEGFSPYADPSTGFELSYGIRFGVKPTFAECKFYDALMLAAFAACYVEHTAPDTSNLNQAINQAIIKLTLEADGSDLGGPAWNATSMQVYLTAMEQGELLHFVGASGEINFDSNTFTAATTTTYVHWQILDDEIRHLRYFGGTGGRSADAKAAWKYLYDKDKASSDFDDQASGGIERSYQTLGDKYALLVQGSNGFTNYRHGADVLNVYQMLRREGFPDDHIILVLDKALATDANNFEQGVIRTSADGPDLLGGKDSLPAAVVDYDSADLTAADIADILLGKRSRSLPDVLPQDGGNNVLFYWSGHGRSAQHGGADEFCWRETSTGLGFSAELLGKTAQDMLFRKLLVVAEPCYGESVIRAVDGIPGALAMSGASAEEQSWADNWNNNARVWMCDRFSKNFVDCLTMNPHSNFRDLFLYCAQHTLGSHARIVGAGNFGNLYIEGPAEFFIYDKRQ